MRTYKLLVLLALVLLVISLSLAREWTHVRTESENERGMLQAEILNLRDRNASLRDELLRSREDRDRLERKVNVLKFVALTPTKEHETEFLDPKMYWHGEGHVWDPVMKIWLDETQELEWDEIVSFAKRLAAIKGTFKDMADPKSPVMLNLWAVEAVPYFDYEGVTKKPVLPSMILYYPYETGDRHNHIAGQASCLDDRIKLNARYSNPISVWYDRPILAVLVHELAHVQGICFGYSEEVESSTQLVTLEILAAMANHGNVYAIKALVNELYGSTLGAMWYVARKEHREEDFVAIRKELARDALEVARFEKSRRYWKAHDRELDEILYKYSYIPFVKWTDGLATGKVRGIILPRTGGYYPEPARANGTLRIDDLIFFLKHAEEMVKDVEE